MSLARFTFTNRARPIIELGVGDNRIDTAGGRWQVSYWDNPTAIWAGTEPLWLDITCITYDVTTTLGRQRTTDQFAPGTASLTMSNVAGWADPNPPAGTPAFEQIRPGCPLRIGIDHATLGIIWLWRGFVDAVEPEFLPGVGDVANISAVCALGEAGRVWTAELPEVVGDGDTASMRFNRILNAAEWPIGARSIEAVATPMLPTVFGEQAANMLTQCADSYGGAVYGDTDGRVVTRNRDWQTYMPDTPVDATVGNIGADDICPSAWHLGHDRADIITRVILAQFGESVSRVYDDIPGQLMYGIETYEASDLICALPDELDLLAGRLLRTRSYLTGSRVDRLVINASTGRDAVDLVTTASVFKPSRWRCRHMQSRGTIFDAELFVTGIRHEISPTAWITAFDLDAAAPWVASATLGWSGGTWDRELWADDVAVLLDEARQLLAEMRVA